MLNNLKNELRSNGSTKKAKLCLRFFKTGKGEYGEGDKFIGVSGVIQRKIAKQYRDISFKDLQKLITDEFHEYRQVSFLILVYKYEKAKTEQEKKKIFNFYIKNHKYANNWDIVDNSTPHVVGKYIYESKNNKDLLYKYAKSKNMWQRRIAILATFAFIRNNSFEDTYKISKILLNDKEDLLHKAVGWMLREAGKRDQKKLESFLKDHYEKIPRTALRYAIEKFEELKRKKYLKGNI